MRTFSAEIQDTDSEIERAISVEGYSHVSQPFTREICYYPFTQHIRHAYITASSERELRKLLKRAGVFVLGISEFARPTHGRRSRLMAVCRTMVAIESPNYRPAWTLDGKFARKVLSIN